MTRYIANADNLKLMMNLLKDKSRNIQFEAFHVFKVHSVARFLFVFSILIERLFYLPNCTDFPALLLSIGNFINIGVCGESQQDQACIGDFGKEPGQADLFPQHFPQ
jgi:hypothetical protein